MTELEVLFWLACIIQLIMPVAMMLRKELAYAAGSVFISAATVLLLYAAVVKTAYTVEAEVRKPLIGVSINR